MQRFLLISAAVSTALRFFAQRFLPLIHAAVSTALCFFRATASTVYSCSGFYRLVFFRSAASTAYSCSGFYRFVLSKRMCTCFISTEITVMCQSGVYSSSLGNSALCAPMAESILQQVGASKSILAALQNRPGLEKVSSHERLRLQQVLRATSLGTQDMGRIAGSIQDAGFQPSDLSALLDTVADVVSSKVVAPLAKVARTATQNYEHLVHYIPKAILEGLQQGNVNEFIDFLIRLGLRHPSEPTKLTMAVLTLVCSDGMDKALAMQPEVKLAFVKSFKQMFTARLKFFVPPTMYVEKLHQRPEDFRQEYPGLWDCAYQGSEPSPCPVSELQLAHLKTNSRMRSERGSGMSSSLAVAKAAPMQLDLGQVPMPQHMMQFGQGLMIAVQNLTAEVQQLKSSGGSSANAHAGQQRLSPNLPSAPQQRLPAVMQAIADRAAEAKPLLALPSPRPSPPQAAADAVPSEADAAVHPAGEAPPDASAGNSVDDATAALAKALGKVDPVKQAAMKKNALAKKAKVAAKGKAKGSAKAAAKAAAKGQGSSGASSSKVPSMPKLERRPPIYYLSCTIYTDSVKQAWRCVERSNMRRDVKFPWTNQPAKSWQRVLQWCKDNAK